MGANWWKTQYSDIKGNAKWAFLGVLWLVMTNIGKHLLAQYTSLPSWVVWVILLAVSGVVFLWLAQSLRHISVNQSGQSTGASQIIASAALTPPAPSPIDVAAFFRQSYGGQLQDDVEKNVKAMIQGRSPNERDEFIVKFIATGIINVTYNTIWLTIFRSQVLALVELNTKVLRREELQAYYDGGVQRSPAVYEKYSFDQWLQYLRSQILILEHPGQVFELTVRGKDFLKYMVHCGYTPEGRSH